MHKVIRFSGIGGQGVGFSAKILGHIATMNNYHVLQTHTYGAESRGGESKSDLHISNEKIYDISPLNADILLSLTRNAYMKYSPLMNPRGIKIVDTEYISGIEKGAEFTSISIKKFGSMSYSGMIALGYLLPLLDFIPYGSISRVEIIENDIMKAIEEGKKIHEYIK